VSDKEREVCRHCGLRIYLDKSPTFPALDLWRHHGSNLRECPITFAEPVAEECTAQAPTQLKPHSSVIYTDLTVRCHGCKGTLIWRYDEEKDEIETFHGCTSSTPQGTPTDLLAVIERLANHGSVEDYTVEGIRAELREALHTFRPQGTPAPDEQAELAIYEQHIAELTARQKKPLSQQDRMWINGYRQGWLACLTRKRPTATPQGTPSECPQCGSKDFWTVLPACHGGKAHKWHAKESK
jgi:hypothetical protein